jgi:hypothetical protein
METNRKKGKEKMCDYQTVYKVSGMLQAMYIPSGLENAGIPSKVANSQNEPGLSILVPTNKLFEAENILYPIKRTAELLVTRRN